MKNMYIKIGLAVAAYIIASQAFAVIPLDATRPGNFTFTVNPTSIPLNSTNATTLAFSTTADNQAIMIKYSAECGVTGTGVGQWLDIDILVDGVAVPPTAGTADAFCTTDKVFSSNSWKMVGVNALYTVPVKGAHTIQIQGKLFGAKTGWLGDSSLVIYR
jgi:hypothetical protein